MSIILWIILCMCVFVRAYACAIVCRSIDVCECACVRACVFVCGRVTDVEVGVVAGKWRRKYLLPESIRFYF